MLETILILVGHRAGVTDTLAQSHGVVDKCCVPVAGVPMLVHDLRAALVHSGRRIIISASGADVGFPLEQWIDETERARVVAAAIGVDNSRSLLVTEQVMAARAAVVGRRVRAATV